MKVGGIKTWKEVKIGVEQLVRLILTTILSFPDLSFKNFICKDILANMSLNLFLQEYWLAVHDKSMIEHYLFL